MTILRKVMMYCYTKPEFTWKQFEKRFDRYPGTATNYLSLLVQAKYVDKYAKGKYRIKRFPSLYITFKTLKEEARKHRGIPWTPMVNDIRKTGKPLVFKTLDDDGFWIINFNPALKLNGFYYYDQLRGPIDEAVAESVVKLLKDHFEAYR